MACTSQSALEYVQSARPHLVKELKDLSVILENLYQEKVFCDEEVRNIQAERQDYDKARKTLDSVIKKGEAACYKFLRIIDMMCKRTLGRTSSLPEKTTEASPGSQRFNLPYWISCYPFKEDADLYRGCLQGPRSCHTYQTKLKTRARKKSTEFWMRNQKLFDKNNKPDLWYSPLVLDTQGSGSLSKIKKFKNKKSKMSRPKKLRTYLPEDKPNISPSDLLKTDKNILLVGKPGIGKTALGHEILKLWAERDSRELDYMFYFDMRETSLITEGMSLEELLFSVYSEPDEGKAEVLQDIKNHSDNVTVILDGVTDLSSSVVKRILKNEILPNAKVIVTCRPDDEEDFLCGDFLRVEVKGFSEQTIQNYFSTILGEEHRKILSQLELLTLCHVPMYALMVAACVLSETTGDSPQPCSMTEIYINIVRFCLQTSSNKSNKHLSSFIQEKKEEILSLAECAFHATQRKTVNLTDFQCEDSCVLSFLKPLNVKVAPTETKTTYAFLHYTVQEFFAALWLLKNPNQIKDVFQQCLTEERKHMKHLIPFMSRLLNEKSPSLMEHLIPAQELKSTADWFFKELINTFDSVSTEGSGLDMDLLFFCQCLYESQCPDACVYFLKTLDYHLDLSGESLDSYLCCAVASVVALSKDRKVRLNLEDVSVSEQGMRRLFECLDNVQWCDSLPQQLWKIVFSEGQFQEVRLLSHDGNQFHLPLQGKTQLFERAVNIIQKNPNKVNVCLHWDSRETTFCPSLSESLLEALPCITSLSFRVTNKGPGLQDQSQGTLEDRVKKKLFMDLCLKAALHKKESLQDVVQRLMLLFSVSNHHELILDLYQHIQSEGCLSVLPSLQSVFQSAPKVWFIDLSKRKTSIFLEVLKLQSQKKPVELRGCSDEESEVRSLLQCLPFISQLSFSEELIGGVKLFGSLFCAAAERDQQTGENTLELLSSVCTYQTFPLHMRKYHHYYQYYQSSFLLDLFSYMKDYETQTVLRVLPSLQSVFQSVPKVWSIDISKRKTSILLEVLKLQSQKKPVELIGCSDEESEVRSLLQCLPFISQLSFYRWFEGEVKLCWSLFCAAAERDQQTGENTLELLSSVCTYQTFPIYEIEDFDDFEDYQNSFLLDLCSYMKDYETQTGLRILPSLQSVFQSVPEVWSIDLSERKTSILLEVLKLQSQKKPVELRGCSYEESEVRSLLQCLPFISQLSCDPEFFQCVCASMSVRSREEAEQLVSLLQLIGFSFSLTGELRSKTCKTIGRVLGLCGSNVDLILTPRMISVRGASLLFRHTTKLHSLSLSSDMALLLSGWVRRDRVARLSVTEELSLSSKTLQPSERVLLRVVSSLASLLRYWTIRRLDLTESRIPAQGLIPLLLHDGPLTIKLSEKISELVLLFLYEIQDKDLTRSFLSKINGDLTPVCLNWEHLHHLLQSSPQTVTVNLRKNHFLQDSITRLLPFLDRVVFKRPSPCFVLTAIREIHKTRASSIIPSLLRSFGHVINLTCIKMELEDCAALLYTLRHGDGVKLNLLWTSIPTEEINSILFTLDRVSQLSVDRNLLLRIVHCCAASDAQQERAVSLLRTLQHCLDLSCSSQVNLSEEGQSETLCLTAADCRAISTILRYNSQDTELQLQDCEVEDSGLVLLFPVLDRVHLRASKDVLLQLVFLVPSFTERDSVSRAKSLCGVLGGELDFSHTKLDERACEALALVLDFTEELTELDLSHCQLTDQLLSTLITYLNKAQVLDLSHNNITDASTSMLLQLISINPCLQTVRLFRNNIMGRTPFKTYKQFEIW